MEGPNQDGAIPVGKMLCIGFGVLQSAKEPQAALSSILVALKTIHITGLTRHAASLCQTFRIDRAGCFGRFGSFLAVAPVLESSEPQRPPRIRLLVLQSA